VANAMLKICKEKLPAVFEKAGPKCERLGYCPEGKHSCGRRPLKEEVLK
jgi:thymidylate synthase (FAD)